MFGPPVSAEPSNSLTALLDKKDLTANFFPIYFYILPQLGLTIAKQDTHTFTCMSNNMRCPLLVSKGTGTWGNPFRASCTGSPCQLKHMAWLFTNNSAQVCGHCLRPRCTHTDNGWVPFWGILMMHLQYRYGYWPWCIVWAIIDNEWVPFLGCVYLALEM